MELSRLGFLAPPPPAQSCSAAAPSGPHTSTRNLHSTSQKKHHRFSKINIWLYNPITGLILLCLPYLTLGVVLPRPVLWCPKYSWDKNIFCKKICVPTSVSSLDVAYNIIYFLLNASQLFLSSSYVCCHIAVVADSTRCDMMAGPNMSSAATLYQRSSVLPLSLISIHRY